MDRFLIFGSVPVQVGATYNYVKTAAAWDLKVGMTTSLSGDVTRELTKKANGRLAAKISTNGVTVEMGANTKISQHSTAGFSVAVGMHGILWKFRFSRAGQ